MKVDGSIISLVLCLGTENSARNASLRLAPLIYGGLPGTLRGPDAREVALTSSDPVDM